MSAGAAVTSRRCSCFPICWPRPPRAAPAPTRPGSTTAWIVDAKGTLRTRSLSHAILPGVTRRVILEAAEEAQLPVSEAGFSVAEAHSAKEAFISSATGIMPVIAIDGRPVGEGRRPRDPPGSGTLRLDIGRARREIGHL